MKSKGCFAVVALSFLLFHANSLRAGSVSTVYNAAQQSGADIFAKANAAFAACSNQCTVYIPAGTYDSVTTTLQYPVVAGGSPALWCDAGATINFAGSGDAIFAAGSMNPDAHVLIYGGCRINGTSTSTGAGIHLQLFSTATIRDLQIAGFSNGDGIFIDGANTIEINGVVLNGNNNNFHCKGNSSHSGTGCIGIHLTGSEMGNSTHGWGVYEDGSQSGGAAGPNIANIYDHNTFEFNGQNASSMSGHMFIQGCFGCVVSNNYFEYGGSNFPTNNVLVGDSSFTATQLLITGNEFASGGTGSNTINLVRASGVLIQGNIETGTPTNFINRGANANKVNIGPNKATLSGTYLAGSDGSDPSVFTFGASDGTPTASFINSSGPTATGYGFNSISGWGQDLAVRQRGGGGNIANFQNSGGIGVALLNSSGTFSANGGYLPGTAGGADAGSSLFPFANVWIGGAAMNNIKLTAKATAAQTATFPDASGTVGFQSGTMTYQFGCTGTAAANTTVRINAPSTQPACTNTVFARPLGIATSSGTGKNLFVHCSTGGVNSSSGVFTVLDSGIATALTCTTGTSQVCSDTIHRFPIAAGDELSIQFTTQNTETLASCEAAFEKQ